MIENNLHWKAKNYILRQIQCPYVNEKEKEELMLILIKRASTLPYNLQKVPGSISYGTRPLGHRLPMVAFLFILLPDFSSSIL